MILLPIEIWIIAVIIALLVNLLNYKILGGNNLAIVGENENTCTNCGYTFQERSTHCPKCAVKLFYDNEVFSESE